MAQSVKCLPSAQVIISQFMGLSPTSCSVLTAWSLDSASDSVSPSLSAPPPLSLSKINVKKIIKLTSPVFHVLKMATENVKVCMWLALRFYWTLTFPSSAF